MTKPAEMPNLAKMIKNGIRPGCAAPQISMQIPPTTEIMYDTKNESLMPHFLYIMPLSTIATSSLAELAMLLL